MALNASLDFGMMRLPARNGDPTASDPPDKQNAI